MLKKLKENIKNVGLSFYRELIIFLAINLAMISIIVIMIIFHVTNFIIFMYALFIPFIDYMFVTRYQNIARKIEQNHNQEFISLLSYFEIFISNHNNVYKSLEMLLPYSSVWMHEHIENLLSEIDLDKSVTPYIRFCKSFTNLVIQNVMVSIYQMNESGDDENSLKQFDYVFTSLSNALIETKILQHEKNIDSLNVFPLFGAGLITITLTLSIISILGELTNVF